LHLSEYKSKAELNNRSLACGRCWLLSDWYCIGCQNNKKYPTIAPITILPNICEFLFSNNNNNNNNIVQYPITQYQYRSNPSRAINCTLHRHPLLWYQQHVIHRLEIEPLWLLDHGTVYLNPSPTAHHLSSLRNISRLTYLAYPFTARIRL